MQGLLSTSTRALTCLRCTTNAKGGLVGSTGSEGAFGSWFLHLAMNRQGTTVYNPPVYATAHVPCTFPADVHTRLRQRTGTTYLVTCLGHVRVLYILTYYPACFRCWEFTERPSCRPAEINSTYTHEQGRGGHSRSTKWLPLSKNVCMKLCLRYG